MSISRDLRKAIEAGKFETIEEEWLTRLEADPDDLEFFSTAARALVGAGATEQAALLLELVDDQLQASGRWEGRLALLERLGTLMSEPAELHEAIWNTLGRLYAESPSLEGLAEKLGLHRATADIPKTWEKVARLRALLQFDLGTPVWMKGKGAGRVEEVNLVLDGLKIQFQDFGELRVGFHAAPKLLSPLPEGHYLRVKLEDPDSLRDLKTSDPGALLGRILESWERPMAAGEIREALAGIVEEAEWTRWWAAARKNPGVVVGGSGRQSYRWAGSGEDALDELRADFEQADLAGKLEIFRKNHARSEDAATWMAEQLIDIGAQTASERPELALGVWAALEKTGRATQDVPWQPEDVITAAAAPVRLILDIDSKPLRERAIRLTVAHRDDWTQVLRGVLEREGDPRLLSLVARLVGRTEPALLSGFLDEVLSQPRKHAAAFVWLAEGSDAAPSLDERDPLRVLRQLIATAADDAFAPYKARIRKLWADGGTFAALIARLEPGQGAAAHAAFERAPVEEYLRTPFINALEMRFSSLRKRDESYLYATAAAIAARKSELKQLLEVEIPTNRKAIETAREMGDLRENFEYKSARQRHEFLSAKASALSADVERARPIDLARTDAGEVRVGTSVELSAEDGGRRRLTILGPWESDPEEEIYSYDSDIVQTLLGKRPGDSVEIAGSAFRIETIEPFTQEPAAGSPPDS